MEGQTMASTVKITTIGNSVGIVLPREVLNRLHVEKGDSLYITESPLGIQLTPYDQNFAKEMEAAKRVMRKHRDVLRKLAE
jgi:putative addiction module antidote